jgi:uncharacterized membrane protein YgdD (TMEM256/DUF423 family)
MKAQYWMAISGTVMALAVGLGAFGAHALKPMLTPELLVTWQTAVQYHLVHGVALLTLSLFLMAKPILGWSKILWGLLLGTVLFSGSLYAWVLTGFKPFVFVTPVGGVVWLVTWLALVWMSYRYRSVSV